MDDKSLAHAAHPPTRELRALDLYRTRGHEIRRVGEDLYLVPSCTGRGFYSVDYREETCDCPDFLHSGQNCKHILALAIAIAKGRILHPDLAAGDAKGRILHRDLAAGDPFIAGGKNRPCACNGRWVSLEVETEDGKTEEVLYLCRRCADDEERRGG